MNDVSLRPGTVLDGKYRIEKVIGQGGFGITYAGVIEEHRKTKVAIKELFIRDYMKRDARCSSEISLVHEGYQTVFAKAKEDFLKEAVIIGIMNKEPAVVNVIDRFKANGTAYFVMEYVEGINLAQYVERWGTFADKEIFRKMLPLIATMKKIHDNEIVHCDISPENIMVQEDGTFKLIDFGAAKNYLGYENASQMVRDGYAPVELYSADEKVGPWTDVYALCATIYYCLTGKVPESAKNRMLFDEMKRSSDLDIRMDGGLERILWKGLELEGENRYQDMAELEGEIRKILPDPKRTVPAAVKVTGVTVIVLALAAGSFAGWQDYKEKHKFQGIETQKAVLIPDESMTVNDYVEARKIIEERIGILAGSQPYRVEEDEEGKIHITTPLSVFGKEDAAELYGRMISGIWNTELGKYEEKSGNYVKCLIENSDIIRAELKTGKDEDMSEEQVQLINPQECRYIKLQVTPDKAKEIRELFPDDYILYFYFNFDMQDIVHASVPVSLGKDGQNGYLFGNFLQEESFGELLEYNLTHAPFEGTFQMYCEITADWESPDGSMLTGENQCREADIGHPSVTVSYEQNEQYGTGMTKGEWAYLLVTLKERLDTLQLPYAIGSGKNNSQRIILELNGQDLSAFYADTLMQNGYTAVISGKWAEYDTPLSEKTTAAELKTTNDGNYQYIIQLDKGEWGRFERFTKGILNKGKADLYIKIGQYYLAQCQIDAPVTDGRIVFDKMCDSEGSSITTEAVRLFRYLDVFAQDSSSFASYMPDEIVFTDESGEIDTGQEFGDEKFIRNFSKEVREKVSELYPQTRVEKSDGSLSGEISIRLNLELSDDFVEKALDMVKCIYEACGMEEGWLNNITFILTEENENDSEYARIYFGKQQSRVKDNYYINVLFQNGKMEWYKEEMLEKIKKDDFFGSRLGTINGWDVKI